MLGKKTEAHEGAAHEAETHDSGDEAMTRGAFMQHLHTRVNSYAEHWDEARDPKATEPATEKAWLADFKKWLG